MITSYQLLLLISIVLISSLNVESARRDSGGKSECTVGRLIGMENSDAPHEVVPLLAESENTSEFKRVFPDGGYEPNCTLSSELISEHYDPETKIWIVDDVMLKAVGNDIQLMVDCAYAGDQMLFQTTKIIIPSRTVVVNKTLTLGSYDKNSMGTAVGETEKKVTFRCPSKTEAIFSIHGAGVVVANIIVANCRLEKEAPITISGCVNSSILTDTTFRHVSFVENEHVNGSPGIDMTNNSCTRLVLESVSFKSNSCSQDFMAVVVAEQGNEILANGISAIENSCTVISIRNGTLTVADSTFSMNKGFFIGNDNNALGSSLRFDREAVGTVKRCTISGGTAKLGGDIYITGGSTVEVHSTTFTKSYAHEDGGAIYLSESTFDISESAFSQCQSTSKGGAIYASSAILNFRKNSFSGMSTLEGGGTLYAAASVLNMTEVHLEGNGTGPVDGGGFLMTEKSDATVTNLTCLNQVGRNGGCIFLSAGSRLSIDKSTFSNGKASLSGGAILLEGSEMTATNLTFDGNTAQRGGGLALTAASTAFLTDIGMFNQEASLDGGSIYLSGESSCDAKKLRVEASHAYDGGAVYSVNSIEVHIEESEFMRNDAKDTGGALHVVHTTLCILSRLKFRRNNARSGGAGIFAKEAKMVLSDLKFLHNSAEASGGAISVKKSVVTAHRMRLEKNNATSGGGLSLMSDSQMTLSECTFVQNSAVSKGGAISSFHSTVTGNEVEFENHTAMDGAGCYFFGGGFDFKRVRFSQNIAIGAGGAISGESTNLKAQEMNMTTNVARSGGGIYALQSDVVLQKTIFTNNEATSRGGGATNFNGGTFKASETIVEGNTARKNGAGFYLQAKTVELIDCSFTNNRGQGSGGAVNIQEASATIGRITFTGNKADYDGGALLVDTWSAVSLDKMACVKNTAGGSGGCLYVRGRENALTEVNACENGASIDDGDLYFDAARVKLTEMDFLNDKATQNEGGFFLSAYSLVVSELNVTGNKAATGAGLYVDGATVNMTSTALTENESANKGGAFAGINVKLTATNSTIALNKAAIGGGLYFSRGGALSIRDGNVLKNIARQEGGAIYADSLASVSISDMLIDGNVGSSGAGLHLTQIDALHVKNIHFTYLSVKDDGAAIHATDVKSGEFTDITARNCSAHFGGAFFFERVSVEISNAKFIGNRATGNGGAISFNNCPSISIISIILSKNSATFGGGFYLQDTKMAISKCNLNQNKAHSQGGAIYSSINSEVVAKELNMTQNEATSGGAICATGTNLILSQLNFDRNNADFDGGALSVASNSTVSVAGSTLTQNTASIGGAMKIDTETDLSITNCTLHKNRATESGGAIATTFAGRFNWKQVVFTANEANQRGGAVYFRYVSSAELFETTFKQNSATDGGAISVESIPVVIMKKCDLIQNRAKVNGGAVHSHRSAIVWESVVVDGNEAESGGALYMDGETALALSCNKAQFLSNTARKNGGAVYLTGGPTSPDHVLQNSRFQSNTAQLGGGIYFERSENQARECENVFGRNCTGVQLWNTGFEDNSAHISGAIAHISDAYGLRYSCQAIDPGSELQTLEPLFEKSAAVSKSKCRDWLHNTASGSGVVLSEFSAKPRDLNLQLKSRGAVIVRNSEQNLQISAIQGTMIPTLNIVLVDAFGNKMSPLSQGHFAAKIQARPEFLLHGTEVGYNTIDDIVCFTGLICKAPVGQHTLQLVYSNAYMNGTLPIMVKVSECPVGTQIGTDLLCHKCNPGEISLHGRCIVHPGKGGGGGDYRGFILPEGEWHKSPCQKETYTCLSRDACRYDERQLKIQSFLNGTQTNCSFTAAEIGAYEDIICDEGYGSALCASCKRSYGLLSLWTCVKCQGFGFSAVLYLAVIVWTAGVASLQIMRHSPTKINSTDDSGDLLLLSIDSENAFSGNRRRKHGEEKGESEPTLSKEYADIMRLYIKNRVSELFKVMTNFLQSMAIMASLDVEWPSFARRFLEAAGTLGGFTSIVSTFVTDCLAGQRISLSRPTLRFISGLCTPVIVSICVIGIWKVYTNISRRAFVSFTRFFRLTLYTVLYVQYLSITKLAVSMLHCIPVHDSLDPTAQRFVLAEDTALECYKGEHWPLIIAAIATIVVFSIGFPILCFMEVRRCNAGEIVRWCLGDCVGFMFWTYQLKYYYWESLVFIRKAALATICVFSHSIDANQQRVYMVGILLIALCLHMTCSPYLTAFKLSSIYESISLVLSITVLLVGMAIGNEMVLKPMDQIVDVAVVMMNVAFVGAISFHIWYIVSNKPRM